MKDERILFIGGPKDGKREPSTAGHHLQTAHFTRRDMFPSATPMPAFGIETHHFTIKQFIAEDGTILKVAVHDSIKDVMKQLVNGYHYHRRSRSKYR